MAGFIRASIVAITVLVFAMPHNTFSMDDQTPSTGPSSSRPTLFIVGDSTAHNPNKGQRGWGDEIDQHFDTGRINVVNRALGGRSSRTYQTDGSWDKVLADMKPGDYMLVAFGHNDPGPLNDDFRARGTIRGTGDKSEEIDNILTKKHEVVHTYGWYMTKYVRDAKTRGVTPVVVSYTPRCPRPATQPATNETAETKNDPPIAPGALTSYALWASQVAEAEHVAFVDLHGIVGRHYATLAPEEIKKRYFCEADYLHTSPGGAKFNAAALTQGLRQLKDCDLAKYLRQAE